MWHPPRSPSAAHPVARARQTPSNKSVELTTIGSNYHIEINPGDAGIYDHLVVQEMVKEVAQFRPLDAASHQFKGEHTFEAPSAGRCAHHLPRGRTQ